MWTTSGMPLLFVITWRHNTLDKRKKICKTVYQHVNYSSMIGSMIQLQYISTDKCKVWTMMHLWLKFSESSTIFIPLFIIHFFLGYLLLSSIFSLALLFVIFSSLRCYGSYLQEYYIVHSNANFITFFLQLLLPNFFLNICRLLVFSGFILLISVLLLEMQLSEGESWNLNYLFPGFPMPYFMVFFCVQWIEVRDT